MKSLNRYAVINKKLQREMVLLIGNGCKWRKCTFCDYYKDTSASPYEVNKEALKKVTGQYGVLDVINSGSCFELDEKTISLIRKISCEKSLQTLWFEAHWMYHKNLNDFKELFNGKEVKFRTGVETFNIKIRNLWRKGIPDIVTAEEISKYFQGVCLLVGVKGQTKEMILKDIEIADKYFEYFSVNVFNENTTDVKPDKKLIDWFVSEIAPKLENNQKVEVLIQNTDLGLG